MSGWKKNTLFYDRKSWKMYTLEILLVRIFHLLLLACPLLTKNYVTIKLCPLFSAMDDIINITFSFQKVSFVFTFKAKGSWLWYNIRNFLTFFLRFYMLLLSIKKTRNLNLHIRILTLPHYQKQIQHCSSSHTRENRFWSKIT